MGAPDSIRITFARAVDTAEPAARLLAAGFDAQVAQGGAAVVVPVRTGSGRETLAAVSDALDAWLEETHLPFSAERTSPTSLVVRPPAD